MKTYGGVDVQIQLFLTSEQAGGEWSDSRPCRFTPSERAPGTHWIGGSIDPRKVKILKLKKCNDIGNRTGDHPACSIVPEATELPCTYQVQ
jgi:hypothetical protein